MQGSGGQHQGHAVQIQCCPVHSYRSRAALSELQLVGHDGAEGRWQNPDVYIGAERGSREISDSSLAIGDPRLVALATLQVVKIDLAKGMG